MRVSSQEFFVRSVQDSLKNISRPRAHALKNISSSRLSSKKINFKKRGSELGTIFKKYLLTTAEYKGFFM